MAPQAPARPFYDNAPAAVVWTFLIKPIQGPGETQSSLPVAGPGNLSLPCVSSPFPSHLFWVHAALGLSFLGQPSSSPGPAPHPSEREGGPALAPFAHLHTSPQPWPFLPPTCSQEGSGSELDLSFGQRDTLPSVREARPWFFRSFKTQELDSSFEVLWTSHLIPDQGLRLREALCPLGKCIRRSLGSSTLSLCSWARATS